MTFNFILIWRSSATAVISARVTFQSAFNKCAEIFNLNSNYIRRYQTKIRRIKRNYLDSLRNRSPNNSLPIVPSIPRRITRASAYNGKKKIKSTEVNKIPYTGGIILVLYPHLFIYMYSAFWIYLVESTW